MLDITATVENRATMLEVVKRVAAATTIPFTVGGGIKEVASARAVIGAGANKVSTSSAAFRNPKVIAEMIRELGPEKVTVAIDVDRNPALPSGYEVYIDGGRTTTGADALEWARQIAGYGVRCILPTSKATDGARTGFDLPLIRMIASATQVEVVASGGAGTMEHFREAAEADSPERNTGIWTTGIGDREANYVFLYDHDGHYSKLKIVNWGGGVPGEPAWVDLQWYYNETELDERF